MVQDSKFGQSFRDLAAMATVALFMFPIFWTALDSIKPASAVYDKDRVVWFNFVPSLSNYFTVLGAGPEAFEGPDVFDSRPSLLNSIVVAMSATLLVLMIALPAAYALWRFLPHRKKATLAIVLFAWMLPPIALIYPLFQLYHATGLFDTRTGLILVEAAIHLPFAILMLKSFFDDLPPEIGEAAMLDGASDWQVFTRVSAPMIKGGITATAIILFIFCWTEFFLALFLAAFTKLIPVQIAIMSNAMGGSTMALSTTALAPCFIFVLLVQKYLVRGFSLGLQR
jgi:multiple sugar transport system permease protein